MKVFLIVFQFLFACAIYGQTPYIKISIDSSAVPAGHNFTVHLESFSEDGLIYPQIPKKPELDSNWFILNISDLIQEDSADFIKYKFSFTAFINSLGSFKIDPNIWFNIVPTNTLIETDEIEIYSVKLDENDQIKPIEPYVKSKLSNKEILLFILGLLLIILLIFFIVRFFKTKRKKTHKVKAEKVNENSVDLFQNCLDELAKLEFNSANSDLYYTQLMAIFKEFCSTYFNQDFKALTDSEFLMEMQENKNFGLKNLLKLETLINEIKYAKSQVYPEIASQHLEMLKQILFDLNNKRS